MRIERRENAEPDTAKLRESLDDILRSGKMPVCTPRCPKAAERTCSRHCPHIAQMLSSDPENYPLETRIVPLAYELKNLGAFTPCWSCEGHNAPNGDLWKVPRVWFYCESTAQLRVLSEALKSLHLSGALKTPWRIAVTHSDDDNFDATFSLEPALGETPVPLATLQRDVDTIAEQLRAAVMAATRRLSRNTLSRG